MKPEEYRKSPCESSSLPYWKSQWIQLPSNMAVVRDGQFEEAAFSAYSDERYFKLVHYLKGVQKPELKPGLRLMAKPMEEFMKHIDECYDGEMDSSRLKDYPWHPTYDASLWIAVTDETDRIVGSAIGELDPKMKEGSLEWVEVSRDYRKQGSEPIS